MKKLLAAALALALTITLFAFAGCGKESPAQAPEKETPVATSEEESPAQAVEEEPSAPTPEGVKTAISKVDGIIEVEIVTEDNDPNEMLGKQGAYTGAVYFTYNLVDQNEFDGDTVIDKGSDGGGCIEIFADNADAEKRDEYLAAFDGSVFASGSHKVLNTLVVRTSSKLKASEQQALEAKLIEALQ
ncbi:MAG: hypothetical protein LBL36_06170 [Clostridiales Family XIII bacterium]|jgi:predicted small lipoprotein YifL|nr:hypothetical protein [Clostridiales Family XIII bacterium]